MLGEVRVSMVLVFQLTLSNDAKLLAWLAYGN